MPVTGSAAPVGADGGNRTPTPIREADFKSAASAVSPRPRFASAKLILACPFVRVAAQREDQALQFLGCGEQPRPVSAADHQRHPEIGPAEIGIGADFEIVVARLQLA